MARTKRWLVRALVAAGTFALAVPAATAANLALVVDTRGEEAGEDTALLVDTLNARGYEVLLRTSANRPALRDAVQNFAPRLAEAERAIIVFAGPVWADQAGVWLLPAGIGGDGVIGAGFGGVHLDVLLALAAELPGQAAVVLAREPREEDAEAEAHPALAPEAAPTVFHARGVPQGVLLVAGPREAAFAAVSERLLDADVPVAEALAGVEDVAAVGFLARAFSFGALPDRAEVQQLPRPPATAAPPRDPDPREAAEAAEAALRLDQAARRRVQEDLTVLGYNTRGIDGIFGPGTRSAIREWQASEGFDATGLLTRDQLALLRERAAARSAELAEEAERARAAEEAADAAFWRMTGERGTAADLRAYLARYPDGIYSVEARERLAALEAEAREQAAAADRQAWEAAVEAGTAEAYRRYLQERPEGAFVEQAQARLQEIEERPQRERARAEAQAREEALGLNQASRALIEGQLAAVGYNVGAADGNFDEDTRRAIREFQARQGLPATGYVDQQTVQALIVVSLGLR